MDPLKPKSDLNPLNYFYGVKGQTSEGQQQLGHNWDCINSQGLSQSVHPQLGSCIAFGAEVHKVSTSLWKFTFSLYYLLFMPTLKKREHCVLFKDRIFTWSSTNLLTFVYAFYAILLHIKSEYLFSGDFWKVYSLCLKYYLVLNILFYFRAAYSLIQNLLRLILAAKE